MNIFLTCIATEQRELLEEICDAYSKFKNVKDLPDNIYGAFYWLTRYSGLIVRSPKVDQGADANNS